MKQRAAGEEEIGPENEAEETGFLVNPKIRILGNGVATVTTKTGSIGIAGNFLDEQAQWAGLVDLRLMKS